ncbi:PREDICTED: uncharacterized protein LOC108618841 [Drosophila arizonae]|uniref:Uncharacterized protein LOC108618841 n=1 Tax=Drosophila arizonae TaxID=7263 RepID=A0ABM1PTI8_DROAR|nr:PREDICTED: uncharacterized protein LOC108618841 [Drosophila arizonae]
MDQKQKSVESVVSSQSNTSRRVMWKVRDGEEEVFDSVVNYTSISNESKGSSRSTSYHNLPSTSNPQVLGSSNSNFQLVMKGQTSTQESPSKSATSLAIRYKPSHESVQDLASTKRARAIGIWHSLYDRIRSKKLGDEESPSLALRYRPSHESLKNRRSKDVLAEHSSPRSASSSKPKLAVADLKLETCFFPPYQTAVVREVAPKFANRICILDDSDSCCSGSLEVRIPLLKSSKSRKLTNAIDLSTSTDAKNTNSKIKRRSKMTAPPSNAGTSKGNGNKTTATGNNSNNTLPTLRQRQLELHRFRVLIEKRRLELLDLKIVRERADALRHEILFHKDLQLKHNQIKSYEDSNSSQA